MVNNLDARLINAVRPICGTATVDPTTLIDARATTIEDNAVAQPTKVRRCKPQKCQKCFCFFGVGEGKHPKFQCPAMDNATSPSKEAKLPFPEQN